MSDEKEDNNSLAYTYRQVAPYLGLGVQLAASVLLMLYLGKWLDTYLNSGEFFTLVGAFLGASGGLYNVIRTSIQISEKNNKKNEL